MNKLTVLKAFPLTFDWIHKEFNGLERSFVIQLLLQFFFCECVLDAYF